MTAETLRSAQRRLLIKASGGVSLPVAGGLYWLALGFLGFVASQEVWTFCAAFGSGLIFPLGLLLAKPLNAKLFVDGEPLAGVAGFAVLAINLLWPLYIAVIYIAPELLPLALGVGMSLHWPIIGWMYGSRACLIHAPVRVATVTALWILLPAQRLNVLPFAVAFLYFATVVWLSLEIRGARRKQPVRSGVLPPSL